MSGYFPGETDRRDLGWKQRGKNEAVDWNVGISEPLSDSESVETQKEGKEKREERELAWLVKSKRRRLWQRKILRWLGCTVTTSGAWFNSVQWSRGSVNFTLPH